ncbi:MAG: phosphoglucosamine mutase [Mycoplasmatales bacterium]
MGKYFGTDGIRGEYGVLLTKQLVKKTGRAASVILGKNSKICIGMDPRESSKEIESILVDVLIANGVDVVCLGVVSTPIISLSIIDNNYNAGIMISASHNPFQDNGIKFFGEDGKKLSDKLEEDIEAEIDKNENIVSTKKGIIIEDKNAVENYIDYLIDLGVDLSGRKIALDCANGSAALIAPTIFEQLGAKLFLIGNVPDGRNINKNVGSTHPEMLAQYVIENKCDYGFAFDGDADRIILVDHEGEILDGDYIIYLIAKKLQETNNLKDNLVIGTVMSNLGFNEALDKLDINCHKTDVGDRYVMQAITEMNASIGGEQSGHIIIPDLLPTGDGILTAVYLSKIFSENTEQLHNLKNELKKFPQTLDNLKVLNKDEIMNSVELWELIKVQEEKLGVDGRILVRASGTESLVRVMVEAKTVDICCEVSKLIINKILEI